MIRVGVIGNSHFGAIKKGWDLLPELATVMQPVFFGSPGSMLKALRVGDGFLYADHEEAARYISVTSGGRRRIEATEYDLYLIVSLELTFAIATDLCVTHRLPEHASTGFGVISRGALESTIISAMRATLAVETIDKLRAITAAPIVLLTAPLPNPAIRRNRRYRGWNGAHLGPLLGLYNDLFARVGAELGVDTYTQPAHTVMAPCFTHPEYALDDPVSGLHHANAKFGADVLEELTPRLIALAGGRPKAVAAASW